MRINKLGEALNVGLTGDDEAIVMPTLHLQKHTACGRHCMQTFAVMEGDKLITGTMCNQYRYLDCRRSAATNLRVPVQIVDNLRNADVVITLKNYYRQQPQPLVDAERRSTPVYILRSNTVAQMKQCLADIFHIATDPIDVFTEAMRETQEGIQRVLNGLSDAELAPRSAAIRSQQHQLARAANLVSHSYGREPYRRVRIFSK